MNESSPLTDYSDPRPESKIGRVRTALMYATSGDKRTVVAAVRRAGFFIGIA